MPKKLAVKLDNNEVVETTIIERLGFNHDVGGYSFWVSYNDKEFMVVGNRGIYRKWTSKDRVDPLLYAKSIE